ncbi:formin [Misgurnus anguillicaudatus]|uniref:formin n=1 Tax=Misgurnus anguillicaudatus TaxID=75329 RepID=UPI003CCF2995
MDSDALNTFFGKLTDLIPNNIKQELQTYSPPITSFHSLTEKGSSLGDNTQCLDSFKSVVQTLHTNAEENRTEDNVNKSKIQIHEMDSAPEKEKLELDLNVSHQRDKPSGTSRSDQDVTDGLADALSKSLSDISASDCDINLDKQLEDSANTIDTEKVVFSECIEGSVNMRDQASNGKDICIFSQDVFENNGHGSDSISSECGTVQNDNQDRHIPNSNRTEELIVFCKEINVLKESCDEETLMRRSSQDDLTETQNMKNCISSEQEASDLVSQMDGDLQNTADATSDINQNTTLDSLDTNSDAQSKSINCNNCNLTDQKDLSSKSSLNSRTQLCVKPFCEKSCIGTEKIQQRDDTAEGLFSQASCNESNAELDSNFVHSPTTSNKTGIQIGHPEVSVGLCDTKAQATDLSKLGNSITAPLEPEPGLVQKIEIQEDSQGKRQREQDLDGPQEEMKIEIKTLDGTDTAVQGEEESIEKIKEREMIQEETMLEPVDASPVLDSSSPEKTTDPSLPFGSDQTVMSPTTVKELQIHLSLLFTGMLGTKKEANEEQETPDQPQSPYQSTKKDSKGDFLEQITQFFNSGKGEGKKKKESLTSPPLSPISQEPGEKNVEETVISQSEETIKSPNTETTLDAFKAFFTVKKENSSRMDGDAGKKKINRDKEALKAFFDRNTIKSPGTKRSSESNSEVSGERTPRRLQTIWPPPKPKDKEEKIGLKYTEAEHQAALLQQKREFDEEKEKIEDDHKHQLFRTHKEHEAVLSKLEATIASLQREIIKNHHKDLRDVAVSTEDHIRPRVFHSVCVQTDRETFIKSDEVKGAQSRSLDLQNNALKNADLNSTKNFNFTDKQKTVSPPAPLPASPKVQLSGNTIPPLPPPPGPSAPNSSSLLAKPSHVPGSVPPPPPPPLSALPQVQLSGNTIPSSPPTPGPSAPNSSSLLAKPSHVPGSVPPPPPPPPPMTGCGPPPPPPPPVFHSIPPPPSGSGVFLDEVSDNSLRKQSVEPVCPMKPLYWTRIQVEDNRNDMLWSALVEPEIINTNEFAELFAKATSPTKRKPLLEAYERKNKARKVIKLLDGKRSQAVGILISSLHLEMKDIQQAVLTLDNAVVDLDAIEAMYENRAQPEELEKIKKHYESSDEEQVKLLDKPEQFLYELSQIPEFSSRVHCFIFQSKFTDAVASIQRKAEIILRVSKHLLEEDGVREIMGLILALGNYMNGGSRVRGQADGFGLEILPKLKDVKSRDNQISLLDYIVSYYLRNFDENAGTENSIFPLPEPQDVFLASQVKFEDLSKDLRKLSRDLAVCEKEFLSVCTNSSQEHMHPFKEKMDGFISNAQNEVIAMENQVTSARKSFCYLAEYFGLKPRSGEKEVVPGSIFTLWFEFCNDFKIRWERDNKTISKQRLKEAQQSVRNITAEKKIETRSANANGLKKKLLLKEASLTRS